ncbi:hypothetical protein CU098_006841, partial [Rhizopus stolonifer]
GLSTSCDNRDRTLTHVWPSPQQRCSLWKHALSTYHLRFHPQKIAPLTKITVHLVQLKAKAHPRTSDVMAFLASTFSILVSIKVGITYNSTSCKSTKLRKAQCIPCTFKLSWYILTRGDHFFGDYTENAGGDGEGVVTWINN